jgi:hypothetical protein
VNPLPGAAGQREGKLAARAIRFQFDSGESKFPEMESVTNLVTKQQNDNQFNLTSIK